MKKCHKSTSSETRCEKCAHYAPLKTPFFYKKDGYPDGITVYGFCAKDVGRLHGFYPVYLPDSGVCKSFALAKGAKIQREELEGQIGIFEYMACVSHG